MCVYIYIYTLNFLRLAALYLGFFTNFSLLQSTESETSKRGIFKYNCFSVASYQIWDFIPVGQIYATDMSWCYYLRLTVLQTLQVPEHL